jgi:hypothetical protein
MTDQNRNIDNDDPTGIGEDRRDQTKQDTQASPRPWPQTCLTCYHLNNCNYAVIEYEHVCDEYTSIRSANHA